MKKIFNQLADKYFPLDENIAVHSERVAMLCYKFAKSLEMTNEDVDRVYTAGLMHDIGTLYLKHLPHSENLAPYSPIIGYMLINSLESNEKNKDIAITVLEQFENFDGSGTPRKLSEDEINIYAMIVHLSDFYDTKRMEGLTHDEVTVAMRERTNIEFPKKIITPFIKMLVVNNDTKNIYEDECFGIAEVNKKTQSCSTT